MPQSPVDPILGCPFFTVKRVVAACLFATCWLLIPLAAEAAVITVDVTIKAINSRAIAP